MQLSYKKIRFWYRFLQALVSKYLLIIVVGAIAGTISFFAIPNLFPLLPKFRPTHKIAIIGRHTQSDIPLSIQQHISFGLTTLTPDGLPSPALAKSWTVSSDGLVYTFELDPSYRWHDHTQVTSGDIDYKFRDLSIEFPSPNQLIVKLKEPFSPLPISFSRPLFKVKSYKSWVFFPKTKLLGLGDYQISRLEKNGQTLHTLLLTPAKTDTSLPNLQYYFYPSQTMAETAFKLGIVDSIENLDSLENLNSWLNLRSIAQVHYDQYVGLFFNTSEQLFGGTQGKNLRLAIAYAIDKNRWPNRSFGPINPTSWTYNSQLKSYAQDLEKAKSIVDKLEKKPDKITISTTTNHLEVAESIKQDLASIGLNVEVVTTQSFSDSFSALLITQAIPQDPDQYNLWHSTQGSNFTHLNSPRIDKLLEDGRKTVDPATRNQIYQDFQKYLVEELPAVFLYHPTTYSISR